MQQNIWRFRRKNTSATSGPDLVRECGEKLTDPALWGQFQFRFERLIFLYLIRALRCRSFQEDLEGIVPDLAQEVYVRLVQHDGRILRSFRGTTEFSVMAFLARISSSVVHDHLRQAATLRRRAQVVPIDVARESEQIGKPQADSPEFDSTRLSAILSWIDVERVVDGDPDRKNAQRNALIFKLHYIDGFQSSEIASFPGFELTKSGVDAVLARLRKRIQQ
jgi:DNA-directed RNA polymerase specialized sigma24 family protein